MGKSNLLAQFALADIAAGRGLVVIDPKGDLIDDILVRADESRLDDVAVVDATDSAPIGINGLVGAADPDLAAERKREQNLVARTSVLIDVTEVTDNVDRGGEATTRDLPTRARRIAPDSRIPRFLADERPSGAMPREKERTTAPEEPWF
ncbi:hypothetical protein ACFWNH_04705 [Rhodococcus qingshengii]|uniref:hypothetical protein n=1 Tax=Rhodococcus qingshengii TaxID=334542 RepID=UPI00364D9E4B